LFKKPTLFQKEILLLLAALLNGKELREIRETFSAIDIDSSGSISLAELCVAFKQAGQLRRDEDVDDIMKKIDFDENGEINYSEFVSSALDRSLLSKENLWKVFKYLDT
jgi:calcium-dependent protein kinase